MMLKQKLESTLTCNRGDWASLKISGRLLLWISGIDALCNLATVVNRFMVS